MFNKNLSKLENSAIKKYTKDALEYSDGISVAIGDLGVDVNEKVIDATIKSLMNKEYKYCNAKGDNELLHAIKIKENIDVENILVTNGSSESIFICLLALINPLEEVIVFNPSYPQYAPVINLCNGVVKYIDTHDNNYEPNVNLIEDQITQKTKIIIVNSPCNPTGVRYTTDCLKALHSLSKKNNIILIFDDAYEDIIYEKKFKIEYDFSNSIYLKSFSKSYCMTGFRLGYILASPKIINELIKIHSYINISVPIFIQKAGVAALSTNIESKSIYKENLNSIINFCVNNLLEYIEVQGGIFIMIRVDELSVTSKEFCDVFLEKYHVGCVPGEYFNNPGFIRVNFSVKRDILQLFLIRLELMINDVRNKKKGI